MDFGFHSFCASALVSRRVALLALGWGYLPFDFVESSISGRGLPVVVVVLRQGFTPPACFPVAPTGLGITRRAVTKG